MKPIVIPPYYIHTRSPYFSTLNIAPPAIGLRHLDKGPRPGILPRLSVMQGIIRYCGFTHKNSSMPAETLTITAVHFGIFSHQSWHCIETLIPDVLFSVDFYVDPQIPLEE